MGDAAVPDDTVLDDELRYEQDGDVGIITLNRPQARNALTWRTYALLEDAVRTTTARCLIVTGTDPAFCSGDDVRHFRPTVIQVNECDCLRDDGVALYHLLLPAGVKTWCGELLGMEHATENGAVLCPEVSRDAARDIAALAKGE